MAGPKDPRDVDAYLAELKREQASVEVFHSIAGPMARNEWGFVCPRCGGLVSTVMEYRHGSDGKPIQPYKFDEAALHCIECDWRRSLLPRAGD